MERYYVGTELKFALTIVSEGFDMDTDPWTATVSCGRKSIVCARSDNAVIGTDGQWYILIDTSELGSGTYNMTVEIDVPDPDFQDGYRHEVLKMKQPLCIIHR